jgi:hypothetical protein
MRPNRGLKLVESAKGSSRRISVTSGVGKEKYAMLKHVLTIEAILVLSISGAMAQMSPGAMEAARACRPDIARLCSNVQPGQGRIKACMKAHIRELSEPCKEALFQAWLRE